MKILKLVLPVLALNFSANCVIDPTNFIEEVTYVPISNSEDVPLVIQSVAAVVCQKCLTSEGCILDFKELTPLGEDGDDLIGNYNKPKLNCSLCGKKIGKSERKQIIESLTDQKAFTEIITSKPVDEETIEQIKKYFSKYIETNFVSMGVMGHSLVCNGPIKRKITRLHDVCYQAGNSELILDNITLESPDFKEFITNEINSRLKLRFTNSAPYRLASKTKHFIFDDNCLRVRQVGTCFMTTALALVVIVSGGIAFIEIIQIFLNSSPCQSTADGKLCPPPPGPGDSFQIPPPSTNLGYQIAPTSTGLGHEIPSQSGLRLIEQLVAFALMALGVNQN